MNFRPRELRFVYSPRASMKGIIYDAALRVVPNTVSEGEKHTGESEGRKLAVRVIQRRSCCTAGTEGGCHHICTLLQLIRLLGMTSNELAHVDPVTCTGRQCTWIPKYNAGGRVRERNIWWGVTAEESDHEEKSSLLIPDAGDLY